MKKLGLLFSLLLLAGCYESPDVTLHEPHAYKGAEDEHHYTNKNVHERDLRLRFKQVQTDR